MTAIELAIASGDHRRKEVDQLGFSLKLGMAASNAEGSRRFIASIIVRACVDVTMYPESSEHHKSAKAWLTGKSEAVVPFKDLADLLDIGPLAAGGSLLATTDGVYRDRVRNLRRHFYSWFSDDGQ